MRGFVSGQSGVAVLNDAERWYILTSPGRPPAETSFSSAIRLLDGATDVERVDSGTLDSIGRSLRAARAKDAALQYILTLLEGQEEDDLHQRIRLRLTTLLSFPEVPEFVLNRLYAAPLSPRLVARAKALMREDAGHPLSMILNDVVADQDAIAAVRAAWMAVSVDWFHSPDERDEFFISALERGVVRKLVGGCGRGLGLPQGAPARSLQVFQAWARAASPAMVDSAQISIDTGTRPELGRHRSGAFSPSGVSPFDDPSGATVARTHAGPSPHLAIPQEAPSPESEHAVLPDHGSVLQSLWRMFFTSLILKDDTGRLIACNDAFLWFVQRRESDLVGKKPSEYWNVEQGTTFEQYDAIVRRLSRPAITRELFGKRVRFTARWPLELTGLFGSMSVYLNFAPEGAIVARSGIVLRDELSATPPEQELCRSFFETCPWAITVRSTMNGCFVYVNRAYRRVFTPPGEKERDLEYFLGRPPKDTCPEAYWRGHEHRIIGWQDLSRPFDSETRVEHPFLPGLQRKVARFNFGRDLDGRYQFRGTMGIDARYLEELRAARPTDAPFVPPLLLPPEDRR